MNKLIITLILCLSSFGSLWATHMIGGSIHYRCLGFGQYEVSLVHYRDCSGIPMPTVKPITYQSASCGSNGMIGLPLVSVREITPVCSQLLGATTCGAGSFFGVQEYVYMDTLTLPQNCTDWIFHYSECCWSGAIVNIQNPFSYNFHTQSTLNDRDYVCNSNVRFTGTGLMFANLGQANVYAPLGTDADGDVLRYRLTSALQAIAVPIPYNGGFSPQNPLANITAFDTITGRLSFTPVVMGTFLIAYNVEEYRNGDLIAVTHRVIQIVVSNYGSSTPPSSAVNNVSGGSNLGDSIFVCRGTPLNFNYTFTDADAGDSIGIIHTLDSQLPGCTYTITGTNPLVLNIQWTPTAAGVYPVGVVVENLGCPVTLNSQVADLTIFVNENQNQLSVSDFYLCSTPTIAITASSGYLSYLWSTGATTQGITVSTAGVYSVTTTGGNCGGNLAAVQIFDAPTVFAGNDTTIYDGDSTQLLAYLPGGFTAGLYIDTVVSVNIPAVGVAIIPLNVQGVFPSVIDSFILESAFVNLTSPSGTDSLELYLVAPNTAMIPLANRRGGATNLAYTNTRFDPFATDPIAAYSTAIPADSTFRPEGDWNHFFGANVNGTWQLAIRQVRASQAGLATNFGLQFGGGFDYQWSPAAGLSCTDCPNPMASPDTTTTYIVAMSNILGCVSYDTVTVFVQPRWAIDTMRLLVAEDSLLTICPTLPLGFGVPTSSTVLSSPVYGTATNSTTAGCFDYQAGSNSELNDTLLLTVCNALGFCDTTFVVVTTISCVWPGDANLDLIVDNNDILPIGLGFGQIGTLRPNASINFNCQPHQNWGVATPVSNIDYKHSDTNGDAIVDSDDTLAIVQNWGSTHQRPAQGAGPEGTPGVGSFLVSYAATLPGNTIRIPILLGDVSNPVDSAYGLAYTIYYDQTMVDSNSVFVTFDTSWMGTSGVDMIAVTKDNYSYGQVYVGMTRTDHTTRNGYGQIGTIQMTIKDDILRRAPYLHLIMGIGQVTFIDNMENAVSIEPQPSYVLITPRESATELIENGDLSLYPNPARNSAFLQSTDMMLEIKAVSASGQLLFQQNELNTTTFNLDVAAWPQGLYFLQVMTEKGLIVKKITKE